MIEQASLVIGNCNWANKEGSLLGYKLIDGKYYPREMDAVRATTATRINAQGLVELVPYNLLQYSNTFSNAAWTKTNTSVTSGQSGYDGSTNAWKLQATATNNCEVDQSFTASETKVFSIYAKAGNVNFVAISVFGAGFGWYNLSNGTLGSSGGTFVSRNIESVGNGWYRCSIVTNVSASGVAVYVADADNSIATTIGSNIFIQDSQLESGSVPTAYQKTETRLNIPRLDYSNGTCPSLLVEPQRTNLATYSSSFDNAAWIQSIPSGTITITPNYSISPDGTQNADRFVYSGGSQFTQLYQLLTHSTNVISIYVKSNTSSSQTFRLWGNDFSQVSSDFTATTEWQRFDFAVTGSGTKGVGIAAGSSGSALDISLYGFQFEVGSYSTSYIPTTSASVTRNADVISKTGISSLIGQTEGSLFWEGIGNTQSVGDDLWMFGTFANDTSVAVLLYYVHSSGYVNCYINNGSSFVNLGAPLNITNNNKIAVGYKNGDFAMYANGTLLDSSTSATAIPSGMNQVAINKWLGVTGVQKQQMKAAALWTTRLTNAQLQQLSSI
jgi:hypothetical protein